MGETKISWTDMTVNPFPGCRKVSPGCQNCYAETMARRLKAMGQAKYQAVVDANGWTGKVGCNLEAMKVPGKGKRVFVNSMGDPFYEGVSDGDILCAYDEIRNLCLQGHTVQVLTKRPERAASLLPRINFFNQGRGSLYYGPVYPVPFVKLLTRHWFGVTAENQEWADKRIPILLDIPSHIWFASIEPLLSPIDLEQSLGKHAWERPFPAPGDLLGSPGGARRMASKQKWLLDWVIVGCESGPRRRPCKIEWVQDIIEQCYAADVPVFVKQIDLDGTVVHDVAQIADVLSRDPKNIRQFPQ